MPTAIDQAPARVLMDRPDADNYPPTRLPSRRSIGIMTKAGSWPRRNGADPRVATTSRIVWRSAQAVPGGGAAWDQPGRYGTIPEWMPAQASGWFLFPWLRQLKQWSLDMEANARPLVVPWVPGSVEPGGTQPETADNGCIVLLTGGRSLEIQGLRPVNASDVFLINLRGGKAALGHFTCDAVSLRTPGAIARGSQGPKWKGDGLIGPEYLTRFVPAFEARLVGYPISYGPGASYVAPGWPEHPLPTWYFNTPAPFGPGPGPDRLPSFCGFALDITDAAIEAWLAHLRDTGRRKSVRYEEARRQFARNLRGWQTDADAPKADTKRPTRVRLAESGSGRHGLESEGTLEETAAALFAKSDVVTEADGWELGDELLEFGEWVVTDGLPAAA